MDRLYYGWILVAITFGTARRESRFSVHPEVLGRDFWSRTWRPPDLAPV